MMAPRVTDCERDSDCESGEYLDVEEMPEDIASMETDDEHWNDHVFKMPGAFAT